MTDQEIIDHIKQDKYSAALRGMYHVLPDVKKYIRYNNGTQQDAQDIFQDALVILCKKVRAGNFTLTVSLKTYLMAVVKNCWLSELRRQNKIPVETAEHDQAEIVHEEEPAFTMAEAAFQSLGDKCRQLLTLFYFEKKDYKTIATLLAFGDERTAKNQKYRCLQKAKEHYITLSKNSGHE